jgi:hypothetical protein
MQPDGNLVLSNSANKALWHSQTYDRGTGPYRAVVHKDGLVVYDAKSEALWQSKNSSAKVTPPKPQFDFKHKTLVHNQSKKCLDSNGSAVYMSTCSAGNQYQHWSTIPGWTYATSENRRLLKHRASGKCLTTKGGKLSMNTCAPVHSEENFVTLPNGSGQNMKFKTGKCLDSNGESAYLSNCDTGNVWQSWVPGA